MPSCCATACLCRGQVSQFFSYLHISLSGCVGQSTEWCRGTSAAGGCGSAPGLPALLNLAPPVPKCHTGEHLWSPPAELLCDHPVPSHESSALQGPRAVSPSLDSSLQSCPDVETLQSSVGMGYCSRSKLHPVVMQCVPLGLHRGRTRVCGADGVKTTAAVRCGSVALHTSPCQGSWPRSGVSGSRVCD